MTNEMFPEIDESIADDFKEKIYVKPREDFKINVPRNMHITSAAATRSMFRGKGKPGCFSWDRITGYDLATSENVECKDCKFFKGLPIGDDKGTELKCAKNYALFMKHENHDKQYVISALSFTAYKEFDAYRKKLLKMNLDVNEVITKMTRIEPPKGTNASTIMFEFEFVEALDMDLTDVEEALLRDIKIEIAKEPERCKGVDWVTGIIEQYFKDFIGNEIDPSRAKKLAESISDGNGVVKV